MENIPYNEVKHICFLMDGDRTYAIIKKSDKLEFNEYAYYSGALSLERLMSMTFDKLKIKYLSLNLIGRRNCIKRPESVKHIVRLVPKFFGKKWIEYFKRNKIRVKFVGDLDLFAKFGDSPDDVKYEIRKIEAMTSDFSDFHLILMAAYEPAYEYMRLSRSIRLDNIEEMKKHYYGFEVPDADIVIRSWRPKLSGCLPIMVSDYANMYFYTAPFQYFKLNDLKAIVTDHLERNSSASTSYGDEEIKTIRKFHKKIERGRVFVLGKKINNVWFPFTK